MENKFNLNELPKKAPYKVPEGYFDTLNKNINNKIDKKVSNNISVNKWQKWAFAAAACFCMFFGINWWSNYHTIAKGKNAIAKIDNTQIIQYLKNENVEIADLNEYTSITNKEIENLLLDEINLKDIEISNDLDATDL